MEKIHVWVTKYALTSGVFECDAEICDEFKDMISCKNEGDFAHAYYHKGEWFDNKLDAIVKAEKMREKKIASINKQLNKIRNLKFD